MPKPSDDVERLVEKWWWSNPDVGSSAQMTNEVDALLAAREREVREECAKVAESEGRRMANEQTNYELIGKAIAVTIRRGT